MKHLMALILCFNITVAFAQRAAISGRVFHEGKGVEEAVVIVDGINLNTSTDKTGKFLLTGLKPGNYVLTVFAFGYETTQKAVVLGESDASITIRLAALSERLKEVVITDEAESEFGIRRLNAVEGTTIN
ncbi:MAG: carboxypeptidase-like regulatory domain-containing protein, partial [Cyclobacteriaceae bacterium]